MKIRSAGSCHCAFSRSITPVDAPLLQTSADADAISRSSTIRVVW
jgi:hypothetical protein